MSNSTILQYIKEARRDVLVEHYIANNVPKDLTDKITNAESLYEYLLLDTKVSELVKTSPIAEAISSVQLYINRCIEGYEGELTAKSKSHFTQGNFLHNWDAYNKRYTTWAGKERLKYYAGSYIDPSLRYNKTGLFKRLEQNISHGRITEESIKNALQNYLTEYEILANLEYISVNKGDDESVLFFVGRTRTMPYEYFWRRLILKRNNKNNLVPAIWSEWKKITANIVEAVDNYVAPYWDKNNLHMQWCSIEKVQSDDEKYIEKQYINDWIMDGSGGWSPFKKFIPYNESFEYSRVNGWFNNPIKKEYIIYDGNQVLCNDPKEYNVNLTALPSHRTNVNFVASYQRYSAILAQGPYDSIVLNESEQEELSIPLNNSVSIRSLVGPPEKIAELKEVLNKQREMKKQLNEFLNGFPDELANLVVVFLDWLLFYLASKPKLFEGLKRLEALLNEIKKQGGIEELKDFKKFINKLAESIKRENLKELEDLKHPINKPIESIKNENLKELEYLKQLINKLDEIINEGHIEELEKLLKKMKEEFLKQEYLDESINKLLKIVSLTYYLLNHLEEKTEGLESSELLMKLIDVLNVIKNEDNTEEVLIILEEAIDIFINYLFSYLFITHLIIPKHLEDLKRLIINLEELLNQEYLERIINQENFEESIKQLLKVVSLTYYILNYLEENTEKLKCLEEIINELNELKKQENPEEVLDRLEIMIVRYLLYLLYYLENNPEKLKDLNRFIDKLEGVINQENPEVILILYKLGGILFRLEETIKIREKKEEILRNLVKSSTRHVYLGQTSLYMYGAIFDKQFKPPLGSSIKDPIHLSIKNNIDLSAVLQKSIDTLFDFSIQDDKQLGGIESFSGPYGLYLWEIFFHIPFLIAVRLQNEQRYELAERWFKFIFNSAGYRDENGNLLKDKKGNVRYWNVVPLQESKKWDETLSLATTAPDEIAMADPMHYKLAIFIHTIELLINRGDHAYRMLERDTLTEAKMYYIQASQLLGSRPEIRINNSWPKPTLESETNAMTAEPTRSNLEITPIMQFQEFSKAENGHFLPPYNEELLAFWDKIELRLFNLRHNLSLDGQPLALPLFAEPTNPRDLQVQYSAGDGLEGSTAPSQSSQSVYRFPVVVDKARTAVNSMIQFGNALENALTKQDTEAMTLLLQSQQQIMLQQTRDIQEKKLDSLQANLEAARIAKVSAESTKTHYAGLVENWMSDNETRSLKLRSDAGIIHTSSEVAMTIAGALDMAPNVFGLATGGSRWGAASTAVAQGLQISANVMEQTANIMDISEGYRRRREDWMLQRDAAEQEEAQLNSQILALQEQINMARKQIVMSETEQAHAHAIYQLQSTRFTSQALYNWMVGRLSSLYYQMYDATVPLYWMAKNALGKEIGKEKITGVFTLPAWNDLYQGLLAGEMLMVELQKLDNLWLEESKRGMEAVKTVSLETLIRKYNPEFTFVNLVREVLNGKKPETINGVNVQLQNDIFSATLDLSSLGLDKSYNQAEKTRKIKNLSVTLPALLGPYQDVEATLSLGGEIVTLSHGMDDSGLFITDFNDSRFLPFEGMNLLSGRLTLTIFHTGKDGDQRSLLESLNDVIFHIRYTIK